MQPLTPAQQERYARHLLLDGLEGAGQERLLASVVSLSAPRIATLWAARYLAASGVGTLVLHGHDAEAFAAEVRGMTPDVSVLCNEDAPGAVRAGYEPVTDVRVRVQLGPGGMAIDDAAAGALLALDTLRFLLGKT